MTDDEELIARLRDWMEHDEGKINDAREKAADRIEELVEERNYTEGTNDTLIALNQALTAKLTKAVEALNTIVDNGGAGAYHLARAVLAELEGK